MKSKLNRFLIVALFVAVAVAPQRAESKVMVVAALEDSAMVASETQGGSSVSDATNVPSTASERQKESAEKPKVRTGHNGKSGAKVNFFGGVTSVLGVLIPIVAIISPFVMIVAVVSLTFYFLHRRNKILHETLRAMIEKGIPVTPELLTGLKAKDRPDPLGRRLLLPGLILAGIGTALIASDADTFKGGLIVLFIGGAFLIVWLLERIASSTERKNQKNEQPPR